MTAVTAACLLVRKENFIAVGGFNEKDLPVAYNDIDLCLKLETAGLNNIYCADATLFHYESVSRGDDLSPEKVERYMTELKYFQKSWATKSFKDNYFSKHLDLQLENQLTLESHKKF